MPTTVYSHILHYCCVQNIVVK